VFEVESLNQRIREELSIQWSLAALVSAFGSLALGAGDGRVVRRDGLRRRPENPRDRFAHGSGRWTRRLTALIVGQSMKLVLGGVAAGSALRAGVVENSRKRPLWPHPSDPATYASVSLLLALVSLVAAYIPARRAARVGPMTALRQE